jgi:uncharacterized Zn-binding protein involved in type VI secretion
MTSVARIGDTVGGVIVSGRTTVYANGIPLAGIGDAVSPHGRPPHSGSVIVSGEITVSAEGIPVARIGDAASCGHLIASGSVNVSAG